MVDDCATRNLTRRIVKWFVRLRVSEKRRSSSSIQRSQSGFTSQLSFIVTPPRRLDAVMLNRLSCSDDVAQGGFTDHLANEDETTS